MILETYLEEEDQLENQMSPTGKGKFHFQKQSNEKMDFGSNLGENVEQNLNYFKE